MSSHGFGCIPGKRQSQDFFRRDLMEFYQIAYSPGHSECLPLPGTAITAAIPRIELAGFLLLQVELR